MYILIDRDRMVLLHKHQDPNVLANLAWIECGQAAYSIIPINDATNLKSYSNMELKMLFRNITGTDNHSFSRLQILQVLFDLCRRATVSEVDSLECEIQAEHIAEDDERCWVYVKGAKRAAQKPDLFQPFCRQVLRNSVEEESAISGNISALKPATPGKIARTVALSPLVTALRPVNNANSPKRGTVKSLIWQVADQLWENAGKPTAKTEVLELRKVIMAKLEKEENMKKGSSSSELGQWHKVRAPY